MYTNKTLRQPPPFPPTTTVPSSTRDGLAETKNIHLASWPGPALCTSGGRRLRLLSANQCGAERKPSESPVQGGVDGRGGSAIHRAWVRDRSRSSANASRARICRTLTACPDDAPQHHHWFALSARPSPSACGNALNPFCTLGTAGNAHDCTQRPSARPPPRPPPRAG